MQPAAHESVYFIRPGDPRFPQLCRAIRIINGPAAASGWVAELLHGEAPLELEIPTDYTTFSGAMLCTFRPVRIKERITGSEDEARRMVAHWKAESEKCGFRQLAP